jgi:hypothetical protein
MKCTYSFTHSVLFIHFMFSVMPHEDSNRAFLIQSQASYQIDDGAKISAGNSLVRRRIASLLVDHMGIEPIDESLARRLRYPIDMARKFTGSHVLNRMLSSISTLGTVITPSHRYLDQTLIKFYAR